MDALNDIISEVHETFTYGKKAKPSKPAKPIAKASKDTKKATSTKLLQNAFTVDSGTSPRASDVSHRKPRHSCDSILEHTGLVLPLSRQRSSVVTDVHADANISDIRLRKDIEAMKQALSSDQYAKLSQSRPGSQSRELTETLVSCSGRASPGLAPSLDGVITACSSTSQRLFIDSEIISSAKQSQGTFSQIHLSDGNIPMLQETGKRVSAAGSTTVDSVDFPAVKRRLSTFH